MGSVFGGSGNTISTSDTPAAGVKFQSSAYGSPIPIVYGKTRIAPNIIWYGDFVAVAHTSTQSQGGKGGGQSYSNTTYTYTASFMLGLCEGPIHSVGKAWIGTSTQDSTDKFAQILGSYDQTPWSYLQGAHSDQAVAYRGFAAMAANGYDLGTSSSLPNHNFEVTGILPYDVAANIFDANPRDIIWDLLQNTHYGVPGLDAGWLGDWSAYSRYCVANGILLSPAYTSQTAANQMIEDLVKITNSGIYFSEALIKIVPYGDAAITANGVTYTPDFGEMPSVGDDDFLPADGEDPVIVVRNGIGYTSGSSSAVAYNQFPLEYLDRANDYNVATVTAQDQAHIDTYGLRPADTLTYHQIVDGTVANTVVQIALQRSVSIRNQYKFKLGWQWCALEPTDIICLNDSVLGLVDYPVRLLSVEEDDDGVLSFVAEDAPLGAFSHVTHTPPSSQGYSANTVVSPGSTNTPVIFQPPAAMTAPDDELWIAASGGSEWGGCEVWVSDTNYAYKRIGVISNPARHGVLAQPLPVGQDPDTAHTLYVDLTMSAGQLLSGSQADADNLATLLWVDSEIISYETASLTGSHKYALTYLRRGQEGSVSADHAQGTQFARLDDAIFKYILPNNRIGSTLWVKLPAFNIYGQGLQTLDQATAYNFTPAGAKPNPLTSLSTAAGVFEVTINWAFSQNQINRDFTEIWSSTTQNFSDASILTSAKNPTTQFVQAGLNSGQERWYWGRVVDTSGNYSDFLPPTTQAGIPGSASTDATEILSVLEGKIGLDQLAEEIAKPLGDVESMQFQLDWATADNDILRQALEAFSSARAVQASAQVRTEKTERVTETAALAEQITATTAAFDDSLAVVQETLESQAESGSANAQAITAVQTRLNTGDYAEVKQTVSATATALAGVTAQYLLQVDANGHVAAVNLETGAVESSMVFLADKFLMAKPDGTGATPLLEIGTVNGVNVLGFKGNLIGASGIFSGDLNASGGTFRGSLSAATGTFGGQLLAGTIDTTTMLGITQIRSIAGSYTFTIQNGFTSIRYRLLGAGAGGGVGHYGEWNSAAGCGGAGGAGQEIYGVLNNLPVGATVTLVIGAPGTGGKHYNQAGADGGITAIYVNGVLVVAADSGKGGGVSAYFADNLDGVVSSGLGGFGYPSGGTSPGGNFWNDNLTAAGPTGGSSSLGSGGVGVWSGPGGSATGNGAGGAGGGFSPGWRGSGHGPQEYNGWYAGGDGSQGWATLEFFNPNSVVLRADFDPLVNRVTALENRLTKAGIA